MVGQRVHAITATRRNYLLGALFIIGTFLVFQFNTPGASHGLEGIFASKLTPETSLLDMPPLLEHGVDARIEWNSDPVPETRLIRHAPGWTILDRLYVLNGTFFIVTDRPHDFPEIRMMASSGYRVENGAEEVAKREPSARDMQIVSTRQAKRAFGRFANRLDGVTFLNNDPRQFINHYYHFAAELFFGMWRTYSSLDLHITSDGKTTLPPPRRLVFTRTEGWRDYAKMNQYIVNSAFPSMVVETAKDWQDRNDTNRPYVLDRVVFADRAAAMRGEKFVATERTASEAFSLPSSRPWWSPIRANVLEFAKLSRYAGQGTMGRPVITYVSRQEWGRRMLIPADHDKLVNALRDLETRYGYEVNVVAMDKMSREEQLRLAGRTTIMLGVHGNGLTALLWMNPTPRSTVIEFFYPGGFAFDYEWTTRALGMIHYGFWGSDSFTSPKLPPLAYPEGFQGNSIPIDGKKVADLIHYRLSLQEEADD